MRVGAVSWAVEAQTYVMGSLMLSDNFVLVAHDILGLAPPIPVAELRPTLPTPIPWERSTGSLPNAFNICTTDAASDLHQSDDLLQHRLRNFAPRVDVNHPADAEVGRGSSVDKCAYSGMNNDSRVDGQIVWVQIDGSGAYR